MTDSINIPKSRRSDVDLGLGTTLVAHGVSDGMPILTFSTVDRPGAPGQPGSAREVKRAKRTVVLRFHSMPAVLAHLDMVRAMMEHFDAALSAAGTGALDADAPGPLGVGGRGETGGGDNDADT